MWHTWHAWGTSSRLHSCNVLSFCRHWLMLRLHQSSKSQCENGFFYNSQASQNKKHGREQSIEFHLVLIPALGNMCISKGHQCLCKYPVVCITVRWILEWQLFLRGKSIGATSEPWGTPRKKLWYCSSLLALWPFAGKTSVTFINTFKCPKGRLLIFVGMRGICVCVPWRLQGHYEISEMAS